MWRLLVKNIKLRGKGFKENEYVCDDFVKVKGCNDCREKLSYCVGGSFGNDNGGKKV